ncbi:MAG: aspartate kinase [Crocosphaera sp.]|nr:aspartate kinase [Crocosphaera sp.]
MTTQILSRSSLETAETTPNRSNHQSSGVKDRDNQMMKVRKAYPIVQQVKYLHLQAEIDVLLQQLQTIQKN